MSKRKEKRAARKAAREKGDWGINRASRGVHGRLMTLLSNFRLSLTYRIAIHYCWQLMRSFVLSALVLSLLFGVWVLADLENDVRPLRWKMPDDGQRYSQLLIQNADIAAELTEAEYLRGGMDLDCFLAVPRTRSFSTRFQLTLGIRHQTGRVLYVTFRLVDQLTSWLVMLLGLFLTDMLRVGYFLRHRVRLEKSVLAPIRDITDMAATLSANNLSNRINIAGTKNELKDLAAVINSMLDRIERSYNSQKQFVSDASHELRTPIAVIQGYVSMLQRWGKSDPAVLEEGISAIAQETASMKDLVESLLFLARHDKKTLMMEIERFDALDVVTELHREAEMVTPADHFLLSPAQSCPIEADRGMIKQVMRILLDNAVKYTPKGGTITMGVQRGEGTCTLFMKDNGPGIPREELPKIFDRFYRSDSARKAENGGHGLGLSIARIIVMAHSGHLKVSSKVGEGTTFCVVLPEKQENLHSADLEGKK